MDDVEPIEDVGDGEPRGPVTHWPVYIDGEPYHECAKPDCSRAVRGGILFCCAPCSIAAAYKCEINGHSAGCDGQWAERRPYVEKATIG